MKQPREALAEFNRYFTSGNAVDVPARISVPRDEWRALYAALEALASATPAQAEPVAIGQINCMHKGRPVARWFPSSEKARTGDLVYLAAPASQTPAEGAEVDSPPWREGLLDRFDEFADESADGVWDTSTDQAALWIIDILTALRKEHGNLATTEQQAAALPVTDAMIEAYLKANDAYWKAADELPLNVRDPSKWRSGTPKEATRAGLIAALATQAPEAAPQPTPGDAS